MNDIISEVQAFLNDSSKNAKELQHQRDALIELNEFWTKTNQEYYGRTKGSCFEQNCQQPLINQVANRMSTSPWHISLDENGKVQDAINDWESYLGTKSAINQGFYRAVACGAGFLHIILDDTPQVELIRNQTAVFYDRYAQRPDLSDAKKCAIVNFVANPNHETIALSVSNCDIWTKGTEWKPIITYYKKENGKVIQYKIDGNEVSEPKELPIDIIPVVRFAGYEKMKYDGIEYIGIVQKTHDLQGAINDAFSTLIERCHKNVKSLLMIPLSTMTNRECAKYLEKAADGSSFGIVYDDVSPKGSHAAPTPITEHFQTEDLINMITTSRTMMEDTTGIKLQGMDTNKTATESLIQAENMEGSVSQLYLHAEMAIHTIAKIIIELVNGSLIPYSLEGGPEHITSNMKRRQELAAIAQYADDRIKPYLAYEFAKTTRLSDTVAATMKANLQDITIVEPEQDVANILMERNNAEENLNEALSIGDELTQKNQELEQQNISLQNMLEDTKAQNAIAIEELKHKQEVDLWNAEKANRELQLKVMEMQARIAQMEADTRIKNAQAENQEMQNFLDESAASQLVEEGVV